MIYFFVLTPPKMVVLVRPAEAARSAKYAKGCGAGGAFWAAACGVDGTAGFGAGICAGLGIASEVSARKNASALRTSQRGKKICDRKIDLGVTGNGCDLVASPEFR